MTRLRQWHSLNDIENEIKMKARSAKNKGKHLQQWVAERIAQVTGYSCGKDELIASREMGQSGPDIRLLGPAREAFPFYVECKNQETWVIPRWINQVKSSSIAYGAVDGPNPSIWLLFIKKNRMDPIVVMDADTFFDILEIVVGE